jgi:LmbE family N-acetylglucosaminyl deacetylase
VLEIVMEGRTPLASPDHWHGELLGEASVLYSRLTKWDDRFDGTEPHRIDHLLYRPIPSAAEIMHWPSRIVMDISDTIEQKLEAIACYRSQFEGQRLERLHHYVRSTAGFEGIGCGFRYGELFALPRPVGTQDMIDLLGEWRIPPPFDGLQR